ncbi:hypothetical protein OQJ46_16585 [Microbulbifer thermotolerans]|uniref:hypothetical protein n=1 Tax=Microbulbifer thermotolerans TaxID=252514 RepID=UPI00224AC684|nr:hypothetical protein [Microbulbifer thermotolerans]MCX2784609.1 hypothetical protein [Microbulbifer thermotolerans]
MAKTTSGVDSRQNHTLIHLSPEQYAHFTEGDGLFIKGPNGNTIGFIHEDNFGSSLETLHLRDRIDNVCAQLDFLVTAVSPGGQPLELNPEAPLGLYEITRNIRALLVV